MAKKIPVTLSDAQCDRLLAKAVYKRDYTILRVALTTALRSCELLALDCGDVYGTDGVPREIVHLRRWKNCPNGTNNNAHLQSVLMPSDLREALATYRNWKKRSGESLDAAAPLFCARFRPTRLSDRGLRKLFGEWLDAAGFSALERRGLSFHALRHTCLSAFQRKHGRMDRTQVLARHLDMASTMIYLHATLDDVAALHKVDAVDRARRW